ncbi:MAG: serine hydrolase [Acidimicrobiaceae bacterium]|nr:serine hydrolase [Acidimicrobiaceae bacterium]
MAGELDLVEPSTVGLNHERLKRVADYAKSYVDNDFMVGTDVLVSRHGKVALRESFGFADREAQRSVGPDTIWRIFSMTKPIVSVAVMQLVEEGKLRLQDPLSDFVPAFEKTEVFSGGTADKPETVPVERPINIVDLLTHTSGLSYWFTNQHPVDEMYRKAELDKAREKLSLEELTNFLAEFPLRHQPGTRWSYSMATDVLGRVIEVIEERSLFETLAERVLDPLGMTDTSFQISDKKIERLAACYTPEEGTLSPLLLEKPEESSYRSSRLQSGGGGLLSTMHDYHRFCKMLINGGELEGSRILDSRTVKKMMENHLPGKADMTDAGDPLYYKGFFDGVGFGLGFAVVQDPVKGRIQAIEGEASWGGMASTVFWVDPTEEMSCIFLTQLVPSGTHIKLRWDLRSLVNQSIEE